MRISDWSSDVCSSDLPPRAGPCLAQGALQPRGRRLQHADGLHIGIELRVAAAMAMRGIAVEPVVEEAVARQIMVDADDVRRTGIVGDGAQPVLKAEARKALPQRMLARHHAAEQIPARPAAQIVEPRLFAKGCGGVAAARSEEHTSELQSLMRTSYAAFGL